MVGAVTFIGWYGQQLEKEQMQDWLRYEVHFQTRKARTIKNV